MYHELQIYGNVQLGSGVFRVNIGAWDVSRVTSMAVCLRVKAF